MTQQRRVKTVEGSVASLQTFQRKKGRLPSYAEMMELFGYASKGGVTRLVDKLIERGVLGKENGKLYPKALQHEVKVLGTITAGFPSLGEEVFHKTISLDEWIVRDEAATYMLQVEGDSMIDAGIHKGDYVIVEMTKDFKSGQIVVAEIDGDWTLKYLRSKKGKQYLEAANSAYPDLYPEESLVLHAKVIGVVRRYD